MSTTTTVIEENKKYDQPENAPEHCPGTESEQAGKSNACEGWLVFAFLMYILYKLNNLIVRIKILVLLLLKVLIQICQLLEIE